MKDKYTSDIFEGDNVAKVHHPAFYWVVES